MVAMGEQNNTCKKAVYSLKTTIRKLQYRPVLITLKLFDTMVLSIFSYGAEIWGFMEDSSLEAVELHCFEAYPARSTHSKQYRCKRRTWPASYPSHMERKNIEILG